MRYLPKSPAERDEMLAAIDAKSIDDLFSGIPERYRLREALKLPGPYSEAEIIEIFQGARQRRFGRLHELSGCGCVQPSTLGGYGHDYPAGRVSYFLHAVPGGNFAGNAAGDLSSFKL